MWLVKWKQLKVPVYVAAASAILLAALKLSVVFFGSWWRWGGMPTPDEWSAILGFSAVIALVLAWYQIRQVDVSNRALVDSNAETQRINLEMVRPRVQVSLMARQSVRKQRGFPAGGNLFVSLENVGMGTARNLKMKVDIPFDSLDQFFLEGKREQHFANVNKNFEGICTFQIVVAGKRFIWFLGRAPELLDESNGAPQRYRVDVEYEDIAGHLFKESFSLDLQAEKNVLAEIDPLERIGRDIEVVGDQLKQVATNIKSRGR